MKAFELRLGNLFYPINKHTKKPVNTPFEIVEITMEGVLGHRYGFPLSMDKTMFMPMRIAPITLTDQWLERAGFEKGTIMANGNTEYYIQEVSKLCGNITFDFLRLANRWVILC